MAITYVTGNAVDALMNKQIHYLLHCCNNKKKMGSGIALEIKNKVPKAYRDYMESSDELGTISGVFCGVVNMVAQDGYGRTGKFINYGAFAKCLLEFDRRHNGCTKEHIKVGLPFKIGSDRAGGDWNIVLELIEFILKDYDVYIYKLAP